MNRIQFESLHCDRNRGGAYVHAMVRVLLAEQTVLAEVTVESRTQASCPSRVTNCGTGFAKSCFMRLGRWRHDSLSPTTSKIWGSYIGASIRPALRLLRSSKPCNVAVTVRA